MTSRPKAGKHPSRISLSSIKRIPRGQYLLLFFCVFVTALFLLGPRLYDLSYGNIDPSFNYAVDNAAASREAFGSQFIATYGPLGYLVANYLPQDITKVMAALALYVLILGVGIYAFDVLYVKNPRKRWLAAAVLTYVLSIGGALGPEWGYLSVFLLYCFIYLKLDGWPRLVLLSALSAAGGVFLLTKFTLGFSSILSIVILGLLADNIKIIRRIGQTLGAVFIYMAVFLLVGHHLGITNFGMYIRTGLIESNNFSGAMSMYNQQTAFATIFTALALLGLLFWPLLHGWRTFMKYLFVAPPLLIIWKYSVARQDAHLLRLLIISLPLAFVMYISWSARTR